MEDIMQYNKEIERQRDIHEYDNNCASVSGNRHCGCANVRHPESSASR